MSHDGESSTNSTIKQTSSSPQDSPIDDDPMQPSTCGAIIHNIMTTVRSRLTAIKSALSHMNRDNASVILLQQQLTLVETNTFTIDHLLQEIQSSTEQAQQLKKWKDVALLNSVALQETGYMLTVGVEVNDRFLDGWLNLVLKDWQSMEEMLINLLK
jgi:hypothetical protein